MTVVSPLTAVENALALIRRSHRRLELAGWTSNDSVLEGTQRVLLGDAPGWRSQSWEWHGSILAEWIRTKRSLGTPEADIVRELESQAETLTPTASIFLSSDLSTTVAISPSAVSAAAQSRLKDLAAKSALANKSSSRPATAPSRTRSGKTPAHAATVAKPGPAPVPGRDGVTLQG